MEARTVARILTLGRIAIGAALVVAPARASAGWIGADAERPATQVPVVSLGARDVVLGAGVLRAPKKQKQMWATAGVACDYADIGAGLLAGVRGQLPPASAAMVTGTAAVFALAGTWLLQQ